MTLDFDERDRASVVCDLASRDEEVRRLAVERVEMLPVEEAIPQLVARLGDESWRVRKAAVARLVACPDGRRAADALVAALADGENPGRRNAAVEALVDSGARVVPRLTAALESDDPDVRKLVVDALAGIADPRATDSLLSRLADPDPNVRAAAADALGGIGGESASQALLTVATRDDEDPLVRFSALHALVGLEVPLRASQLAPVFSDAMLQPAGVALLGECDDDEEAVSLLLKALESGSRATREAALRPVLRLLSRLDGPRAEAFAADVRRAAGPETIAGAIERLEEAELPTRLVLVQFLGLCRVREAIVPVLLAGCDEALTQVALATLETAGALAEQAIDEAWDRLDDDARLAACALFGRTSGPRGARRLLAALDDCDPALRGEAARSIGRRGLAQGLPGLVRRLEGAALDEDELEGEEEMAAVTEAIVDLAQASPEVAHEAIEMLRGRLEGAVDEVRLAIAGVLGCIGRREDTELVGFLLKDPSAAVRRAAVDALARLDPGTAAEPLRLALADESPGVRIAAAEALGHSSSDAVLRDLRRLADDEDPRVRAAAVRAAGLHVSRCDDASLQETSAAMFERALHDAAPVALAAAETLREVGGPHAADRAAALLERPEPDVVREAARCISSHARGAELDALIPLVSHPDWSVRAEAIQGLADHGVARAVPAILRRLETEQDEFVREAILRALVRLEG